MALFKSLCPYLSFPESAAQHPVGWRDSGEAVHTLNTQKHSSEGFVFTDVPFPGAQEQEHNMELCLLPLAGRPSHVLCGHRYPRVSGLRGTFNLSVPGMCS